MARLWALLGNTDPATTRASNQSQRLPGAGGAREKKGGLGTGRTVNTTRDRPDRLDVVSERENKADSFHFTLRCQRMEGEGEKRRREEERRGRGVECPDCQEVAFDALWVSSSYPSTVKTESDHRQMEGVKKEKCLLILFS